MKKLTTKIMDNGKEKDIAVFLDDETAKVLEECGDEELKHRYIVEEYKQREIIMSSLFAIKPKTAGCICVSATKWSNRPFPKVPKTHIRGYRE